MSGVAPAPSARALLAAMCARTPQPRDGERLHFDGVGGRDVYNVCAPFQADGQTIIAGRVEARDVELAETVLFARGPDGVWRPWPGAPTFPRLQDPCVAAIGGELVLGGVEFPVAIAGRNSPGWRMRFYRGRTLQSLRLFLQGPDHMKDIRLVELADGRVGVCSRPQGSRGGRGTIGFTTVGSLDDLTAAAIDRAPLLQGQFRPEEWGGANELHRLADGRVGVLGHIAWMQGSGPEEEKHYYAMAFALDTATGQAGAIRVLASRADFPAAPTKRPGLRDVLFAGGLARGGDGTAWLYAGLGDAAAGRVRIADPFAESAG